MRSGVVESVHRGDIVEVDAAGRMLHALGDPDRRRQPPVHREAVRPRRAAPRGRPGRVRPHRRGAGADDVQPLRRGPPRPDAPGPVPPAPAPADRARVRDRRRPARRAHGGPPRPRRGAAEPGAPHVLGQAHGRSSCSRSSAAGRWTPTGRPTIPRTSSIAAAVAAVSACEAGQARRPASTAAGSSPTRSRCTRSRGRSRCSPTRGASRPVTRVRSSRRHLTVVRDAMRRHPELVAGTRDRLDTSLVKAGRRPGGREERHGGPARHRDPPRRSTGMARRHRGWRSRSRTATGFDRGSSAATVEALAADRRARRPVAPLARPIPPPHRHGSARAGWRRGDPGVRARAGGRADRLTTRSGVPRGATRRRVP